MGSSIGLNLKDVGDLIFRVSQLYLFKDGADLGADITIQSGDMQEMFTLRFPDNRRLLVKVYPHRNFSNETVFRIEVYRTKEGDMRGNKIAFMEALTHRDAVDEIQRFVKSYLGQLEL